MSIFKTSRNPLADELDSLVRDSLKRAMLCRHINEEQLAEELSRRSGRPVKPALVSAWKAETKHRWRLPAALVPIICEILGDDSIQRLLLSEKLKRSLDLGESVPRVISLLERVLQKKPKSRKV
jgi:hypothetical protein